MSVYTLKRKQTLPISLEKAWDFFSTPSNLQKISPEYMDFKVLSDPEFLVNVYPGQVISYTVRPILGIPLFWMTEITQVKEGQYFVDEQRAGPYAMWHHQHHFKAVPEGVEVTDLVHYRIPLGPLGVLAYHLFVRKQVEGIFDFRFKTLENYFKKKA